MSENEKENELNDDQAADAAAMAAENGDALDDAMADMEADDLAAAELAEEAEEAAQAAPDPVVAELEEKVSVLRDQLLRAMAETENIRKRGERQIEDAHKFAVTGFAREILSVADNLALAVDAIPDERRDEHELLGVLLEGVMAVQAGFARSMATNNIERLDPVGEPFDPNLHEAMFEVPGTEHPNGTVAMVVQPGYRLHDRLLRPARVGVAKSADGGPAPEAPKVDTTV
ncbi:MAG: nucleotide exchange factor GrpE [Alphaproteobacteria bacterium]|jgi:molecular chaperone GrpE